MWKLKQDTDELIYKTETDSQRKQTLATKGEREWERDKLQVWNQQKETSIYKTDKQQGPTVQNRELYSIPCDKP